MEIYNKTINGFVLGAIFNDTSILYDDNYSIGKIDFEGYLPHKILFVSACLLGDKGLKSIEVQDIGELLNSYYPQKEQVLIDAFPKGDYLSYIDTIKKLCGDHNFEWYYSEMKKRSLLLTLQSKNIGIKEYWDENKSDEENSKKLLTTELSDMILYYEMLMSGIASEFNPNSNIIEYKAGSRFKETLNKIKSGCLIGDSFQSEYLNDIYNGMYGFILRSGKSGGGKTAKSVGDLCTVSAKKYYDEEIGDFVDNPHFVGGGLMINTELDLETELEPMFIAWIANIERKKIRRYDLTPEELERVIKAGEILEDSPIYYVDDPQFTITSLTKTITEYVLRYDVKNVFFDYINSNGFLGAELAAETKVPQREDNILQTATDRLKTLQRRLGIGLLSGTQLNGKEDELPFPTDRCLAGGKSQTRKVDGCMITMPPTKAELEAYSLFKERSSGLGDIWCNSVEHIIKGRNSSYDDNIKVLQYFDLGTCRLKDLLVLDKSNMPIEAKKLKIMTDNNNE